ncbi:hypothetical protein N7491_006880 [Penicillium cf. griseofulvum]|uniref:Uncharacterized protein n=1 Tax=Penicillium cf. griseofulvum TaxID=2972120 RepID=A0A9W9IYR3_9EURO|nr:hypothetical protein N7472_010090 [Penicillium cf. griseofulvum]KAJ5429864.1 hypothetical protein N7491_006880 [Penicillium cf. griseofulvum]KAJ5436366.1 hypothetical protein N7445_007251 [Penicillium cf. griseofulvum]
MQEYPDIELGQIYDLGANFGASLKDTITVVNNDYYCTRKKKTTMLSDTCPPLGLPRFMKVRVYCTRLLGW